MKNKVIIVVPAFNEEKTIGGVLTKVKNYCDIDNIIVIDDGSEDNTAEIVKSHGVHLYQHDINRGLGGALGTGLDAGLKHNADVIVTMDADDQHDPAEIESLIAPIINEEVDVVIGSRLKDSQGMPITRQMFNWGGNIITWMLFGIWLTDTQSGFRAFSAKSAQAINIRTNKMEVSSEIAKEIKGNNFTFTEVPIKAIYTEYSMSKGQGFFVGIKTVFRLILLRFRK